MPTNVSTSFFFINLLFQARRAGSNPRPSCIPVRGFASRAHGGGLWPALIKRVAHVRGLVPGFSTSRCVAARDKSRPGRRAMARAHQEGCARSRPSAWVLNSRCVAARDKSRPWRRAMARAHQEGCARARGVAGRGLERLSHWGVWPGAVHLGWSKSPRWMGARRCAGGSLPGWAGRKQVWAELFPR